MTDYDAESDQIDMIILPEMALIGYRFEDKDDVRPFCEKFPDSFEALV